MLFALFHDHTNKLIYFFFLPANTLRNIYFKYLYYLKTEMTNNAFTIRVARALLTSKSCLQA